MARIGERKDHPLSLRLLEGNIATIDRAARLKGRSRTDCVRDAAIQTAEAIVMENALVRMSPDGFEMFMAAMSAPATPVAALTQILTRPTPWETASNARDK